MAVTTVEIKEQWQADEANRSPEERGPGAYPRSQMERQRPNRGIASCARCLRPFRDSEPGYACSSGRLFAQRNRRSRAFADHPRTAQADLANVRFGAHSGLKSDIAPCLKSADIVAKVFLRGGTQILRPVGAAIE